LFAGSHQPKRDIEPILAVKAQSSGRHHSSAGARASGRHVG
jgi:hypothetical protein